MMKGIVVFVVFVVFVIVGAFAADVQIVSQFKPEDCSIRSKPGDTVRVHYTDIGKLQDQTVFDSSIGKEPIEFELGSGRVIPGWERGIAGMCIGEKRLLTIPPELGYGDQGVGPIPGKATLIFETELVEITKFGPGVAGQEAGGVPVAPVVASSSLFSTANLTLLLIVGGFFGVVVYLVKFSPELGGSSGPRRSSKSGSSNKLKRSR